MSTMTRHTELAAIAYVKGIGFALDTTDRTWKNADGDEAHIYRSAEAGWTVTVRTAAEVAELERETAIASLIYNLTSEVGRGRDEVKSAIERATRDLRRVTERFDRDTLSQSPAENLRHALGNAAGEMMNMSRVLAEAAVRAEAASKAQENLIRSAGHLAPMMSRVRESIADKLVECRIEVRS